MIRRNHNNILANATLVAAMLLMLLTTGCQRKPLYLPTNNVIIDVAVYDIDLELYFGFDWRAEWQYEWDEDRWGYLGYTVPEWVRATIYQLSEPAHVRQTPFVRNFTNEGGRVSLVAASWYDMLFFNAGTEYILFDMDSEYNYYNASTRSSNSRGAFMPATRDGNGTDDPNKQEAPKSYYDYNQPDEFFGVFVPELYVSEDPDDYDAEYNNDGSITYIYRINATMQPYTFIYLYQVVILNNYIDADAEDAPTNEPRIKSCRGVTVTGLSQGVNLYNRADFDHTVSISTEDMKPMQTHRDFILKDGTVCHDADITATRMLSWGLPGIDPIQARHRLDDEGIVPVIEEGNYIGVGVTYRKGKTAILTYDISEQMALHPAGGVITIVIDAADLNRGDIEEENHQSTGGGFNATVENWTNEYNADITI